MLDNNGLAKPTQGQRWLNCGFRVQWLSALQKLSPSRFFVHLNDKPLYVQAYVRAFQSSAMAVIRIANYVIVSLFRFAPVFQLGIVRQITSVYHQFARRHPVSLGQPVEDVRMGWVSQSAFNLRYVSVGDLGCL